MSGTDRRFSGPAKKMIAIAVGNRQHQQAMVAMLESIDMRPVIDRIFPFESIGDAVKYQSSGLHVGKIGFEW